MVTFPITSAWKPIELPILKAIELTTDACELYRAHWPRWAVASTQFNRILAYSHLAESNLHVTSASTGILAALLTERIDLKDTPQIYNYNIYLIVETKDGRLFQSPPIKPSDPTHRSSSPSTWFEGFGSPL